MALYYLITNIRVGGQFHYAGSSIDNADPLFAQLQAAGGYLLPASTPGLAAAAEDATALRLRGGDPNEIEGIMQGAVDSKQDAAIVGQNTVDNHTTGLTVNSGPTGLTVDAHAARQCISFSSGLQAAGVTIHAQDPGGAALDLVAGFTNQLPRRTMTITRGAGGPATVDYTCYFNLPDGTGDTEVVTVAASASATTLNAGVWTRVTTAVDPVSTSDFVTGDGFCVGTPYSLPFYLSCDGVVEAAVSNEADSGTIVPTTAPDGIKEFAVAFTVRHVHTVTDAGHVHAVTDAGHVHTLS